MLYRWEGPHAAEFWRLVDFYIDNGYTVTQIGDALKITNFVGKYALQRERRHD